MVRDEALKLSAALQERFGTASELTCAVKPIAKEIEFNAPGGGRPRIVRYQIVVSGAGREAHLSLDEAEELLGSLETDAPPDAVFAAITSAVKSAPAVEPAPAAGPSSATRSVGESG